MSTHQMHHVEQLCDRILLMDHGRNVLHGPLDEIRRRFAGHAVLVRAAGELPALPGGEAVTPHNHAARLTLAPTSHPQDVLKALVVRDVVLEQYEVALPSLDEIFPRCGGRRCIANVWLVARHEYSRHVLKRSFLLALRSVPTLVTVMIGISVLTGPLRADQPLAGVHLDTTGLPSLDQLLPAAAGRKHGASCATNSSPP
jgi:hypothetical protein